MALGSTGGEPLNVGPKLNWVFLIELIVSGILTLLFLFYLNRLFARLVSYGIRAYTWHYYRASVDIQALQISLLGGRIFFKGFRYHGENETILVHSGYLTWRYWLRSVRKVNLSGDDRHVQTDSDDDPQNNGKDGGPNKQNSKLPCRIELTVHGLEWFVYNRSAAYDAIRSGFGWPQGESEQNNRGRSSADIRNDPADQSNVLNDMSLRSSSPDALKQSHQRAKGDDLAIPKWEKPQSRMQRSSSQVPRNDEAAIPKILALLPVSLVCQKGAMVVGNEHTKTILTTSFEKGTVTINAGDAGPLDIYRHIFEFDLVHAVVQLRPNPDYKHSQFSAIHVLNNTRDRIERRHQKRNFHWRYQRQKRRIWHTLRDLVPYFQNSVESFRRPPGDGNQTSVPAATLGIPGERRWIGLTRYLDEEDRGEHESWNAVEYGRFPTLLDCSRVYMCYSWDIPGSVVARDTTAGSSVRRLSSDINGSHPPQWGMHLGVHGGMVNYGPWADRERANIQSIFFPNPYRSSQPAKQLLPGQRRQHTIFQVTIAIHEDLELRIPTREPSKDWQWRDRATAMKGASRTKSQKDMKHPRYKGSAKTGPGPEIRPFGWFSLKIEANSTIKYDMGMVASIDGYRNQVDLDLQGTRLTSSVNHGQLWRSGCQKVSCDLSNPLEWNNLRVWSFDVKSHDLEVFLLRDHVYLLTDLVNDWASGLPPDFYAFVPFRYLINPSFSNFQLHLNVNDSNIINNPADVEDNAYLVIRGNDLTSCVSIPMIEYKPDIRTVSFDLNLSDGGIDLLTPQWNTLHTFLFEKSVATLDNMKLVGTYTYNIATSPALTDTLTLELTGSEPKLYLYGFLIRYFMKIRENYFGEHQHFKTLEEFQESLSSSQNPIANSDTVLPHRSNDLDVVLQIVAENGSVFLPAGLYDRRQCVNLKMASVMADMRFTNYYMDLEASFSPATITLQSAEPDGGYVVSKPQLFVDGVGIYGHRLFGLPPAEPTYVCNWDFRVGRVSGDCSATFLRYTMSAVRYFVFLIDDEENALPPLRSSKLHDVTFLRAVVASIRIWVGVEGAAFLLSSAGLNFDFSDLADSNFSERLNLRLPDLTIAVTNRKPAVKRHENSDPRLKTCAVFKSSINFRVVERKASFLANRSLQQQHIRTHDQRTIRTPWLLRYTDLEDQVKVDLPAMQIPHMPEPVTSDSGCVVEESSSVSSLGQGQQFATSQFDSLSSLSLESTKRTNSAHLQSDQMNPGLAGNGGSDEPRYKIQEPRALVSGTFDTTEKLCPRLGLPRHRTVSWRRSLSSNTSSRWVAPTFNLQGFEPDERLLPTLMDMVDISRNPPTRSGDAELLRNQYDDNLTQTYFAIEMYPGLRGFLNPESMLAVSSLLDDLQPSDPRDIIDGLQTSVVTDIFSNEKLITKGRKIKTLSVRVPALRVKMINSPKFSAEMTDINFEEEFETGVTNLNAVIRSKVEKMADQVAPTQYVVAVHVRADSISFAIKAENKDVVGQTGVLQCHMDDILLWSAFEGRRPSLLRVKNVGVTTSKSAVGLALLAHRASRLADLIKRRLVQASERRTRRLRCLLLHLSEYASCTPNPQFWTRPAYVLRVAGEHLRRHDTWKLVSRFRHIYISLPKGNQQELEAGGIDELLCPADAVSVLLSRLNKWRTWDFTNAGGSYFMQVISDQSSIGHPVPGSSKSMVASISIKSVSLTVDPGPKQNNWTFKGLSTTIRWKQVFGDTTESTLLVQTYCTQTALSIKWEILEFIDSVLRHARDTTEDAPEHLHAAGKPDLQRGNMDLHIILEVKKFSIMLDSINVRLATGINDLKASVIQRTSGTSFDFNSNIVLTSRNASAEITRLSKGLLHWRLWDPTLFVSYEARKLDSKLQREWKCATACRKLLFELDDDPLGLLQVADHVVEDEIKHILEFLSTSGSKEIQQRTSSLPVLDVTHILNFATFLDDYEVCLSLLPSAEYVISGGGGRLSLSPVEGSKFELDYDIKENFHTLLSTQQARHIAISTLVIPPINGRVVIDQSIHHTILHIESSIEVLTLEASAVRNLLEAVMNPEISHLISELNHGGRVVKEHIDQVLFNGKSSPQSTRKVQNRDFGYKIRLSLAGFSVRATAPSLRDEKSFADLSFNSGMVQIRFENVLPNETILGAPQFHIHLSQLILDLQKRADTHKQPYGRLALDAQISGTSNPDGSGDILRCYHLGSRGLEVELFAETASMVVDIAAYLQQRLKTMDMTQEIKHLRKLRLVRFPSRGRKSQHDATSTTSEIDANSLFNAVLSVDLARLQVCWIISEPEGNTASRDTEDLVFSISRINLTTRKQNAARLRIEEILLQMLPKSEMARNKTNRSSNSALLPQVIFNVSYVVAGGERRLTFQAAGKTLDIRVTPEFILPASVLQRSIASASTKFREAVGIWVANVPADQKKSSNLGLNRLTSLLVDADFAGGVVSLQGQQNAGVRTSLDLKDSAFSQRKYSQYVTMDAITTATLRAPGVAFKVQFDHPETDDPTLNAEIKVDGSENVLYPTVVPLIARITSSIQEVVGDSEANDLSRAKKQAVEKTSPSKPIGANDPTTILGRCRLNMGLRICKQGFTLSCQPIARVAATARFDDSYITVNTVQSSEHRRFFALLVAFNHFQAAVKHVYSSESTASFHINSVVMSIMNSKHVSSSSGISAILKVSPTLVQVNAKQVQDFLLFREIWAFPDEISRTQTPSKAPTQDSQAYIVQRYQQVAAASTFPWNTTLAVDEVNLQIDLGQTVGKSEFTITDLWLSSKKSSDWEQTLCIALKVVDLRNSGRLRGFVKLNELKIRSSIRWPDETRSFGHAPLVQAAIGFLQLQANVSFEYQPFLVADVTSFDFYMYNVRHSSKLQTDRLVSVLEGDKVQVYCTALTASQGLALFQTLQRLAQEKRSAYEVSLKEIETYVRHRSPAIKEKFAGKGTDEQAAKEGGKEDKLPVSLHTNVTVNLKIMNIGAFPSTFHDNQVFKLEALDAEARFSVALEGDKIHNVLGLTLGQLRVALSPVNRSGDPAKEDLSVDEVVLRATGSRGGTILKVPRVVATMETWQNPQSTQIEYIFSSSFEGKVDVGWNYSRISFIRSMWNNHSRALASRLGKPLPRPAVQITGGTRGEGDEHEGDEKITAVVNVPQSSKYTYVALEPPVIETPQLRDMGEATPPLEWIGLHRDKLPNITHHIIIVTLMEIARDVEDAYSKILGSS